MRRALISVHNKEGLIDFARGLKDLGWEIISTGGTARAMRGAGIEVREVSDITGFPEILDGRVKTLHPVIHAGILARRDIPEHMETLEKMGIRKIDLVAVNLYPFKEVSKRKDATFDEIIENIDIGGPTMVRASAKNFRDVIVVVDPKDYPWIVNTLKEKGDLSLRERFALARKAFHHTASYDAAISNLLHSVDEEGERLDVIPEKIVLDLGQGRILRYGENPHQKGAFFGGDLEGKILQGKELSYNNILDAEGAYWAVLEFNDPAVVIVKHTNPCGVCESSNLPLKEIFIRARECDPVSAFGGIIAMNTKVDGETAEEITKHFYEVLIAPKITQEAREVLKKSPNLRVIEMGTWKDEGLQIRSAMGGYLVQERDSGDIAEKLEVVTEKAPSPEEMEDLIFGMKVVKHVKSNAIVVVKDKTLIGVGAGQMSRVDSVKIAMEKARTPVKGAYLASDAFFPFPDSIELASKAGIRGIIQPGGSVRDKEVIEACNRLGLFMVFTGKRHFKH